MIFFFLACENIQSTPTPTPIPVNSIEDSSDEDGTTLPDDSTIEEQESELPKGEMTWQDCSGTLHINFDTATFSWFEPEDACSLQGNLSFEEDYIRFGASDMSSCPGAPWWIQTEEHTIKHQMMFNDNRLSLVPQSNKGRPYQVEQFTKEIYTKVWEVSSDTGEVSRFTLCTDQDGTSWGGRYHSVSESCDFISCGGGITEVAPSSRGEHWRLECGGDCPCSGFVTVENELESEAPQIEGVYHASNCARVSSGTFTGALISPRTRLPLE